VGEEDRCSDQSRWQHYQDLDGLPAVKRPMMRVPAMVA